jgi:hypothetical protein
MSVPTEEAMRLLARKQYEDEGTIEIDNDAKVSRAYGNPDSGAYVEAWVWVEDPEREEESCTSTS